MSIPIAAHATPTVTAAPPTRRFASQSRALAALGVLFAAITCTATAADGPANPDFEDGAAGATPPGWFCPTPGYKIELVTDRAKSAKQCAKLSGEGQRGFGNLMQSFDATPFRGKRIKLSAWLRIEAKGEDAAQMWLRVDRAGDRMGLFDNMGDRPVRSSDWKQVEIVGNIDRDAKSINIGFMLMASGAVFADGVKFEVLGDTTAVPVEAARPLTGRGAENLISFAKLLGYVRHFHPSDGVAATDWSQFAIDGVRAVEAAESPEALAKKLTELFAPIAPTVQVFVGAPDAAPAPPTALNAPTDDAEHYVRRWKHMGFGGGNTGRVNIYSSKRTKQEVAAHETPGAESDPARNIWRAALGGGVSCCVPLALYADKNGTLPADAKSKDAAGGDAKPAKEKEHGAAAFSADDRATRLADVILAWNVMQHFYPYFDVVQTDWNAALGTALASAATDADECAFLDTLKRLGAELHDGHVWLNHRCEMKTAVPAFGACWVENKLIIARLSGGDKSAATPNEPGAKPLAAAAAELEKQGVKPGDAIVAIDGVPTETAIAQAEALISGATPQWRRWRSQRNVLGGADGSSVKLEIEHLDGTRQTITARRVADGISDYALEQRPEPVAELKPGVMYIDIDRVTDAEFGKAESKLAAARGIVVDFRGYPRSQAITLLLGHLTGSTLDSPQWHVPTPTKPDRVDLTFDQSGWKVQPTAPRYKAKVAFITDGRAISAAETFMGIAAHYKLGEIIGSPTAGTNGNVNPIVLPGGFSMSWTGMKVLTQDGKQHHGVGIQPTIPAKPTRAGIAAGKDELLELAIETVSK